MLVLFEVGSALTKHLSFAGEDVARAFQSLLDLGLKLRSLAEPNLLKNAFLVSRDFGITFYDAAYVALATDARLITADKDLYMKTKKSCDVQLLRETKPEELAA
jgi:predicted nucleic acid-binding protein